MNSNSGAQNEDKKKDNKPFSIIALNTSKTMMFQAIFKARGWDIK